MKQLVQVRLKYIIQYLLCFARNFEIKNPCFYFLIFLRRCETKEQNNTAIINQLGS